MGVFWGNASTGVLIPMMWYEPDLMYRPVMQVEDKRPQVQGHPELLNITLSGNKKQKMD